MDIPATVEERQAEHDRYVKLASGALDWTEGQQKVYGYIGAGWRMRAAHDEAMTLFNHLIAHGPEQVFADTPEGENSRTLIGSLLHSISSLKAR